VERLVHEGIHPRDQEVAVGLGGEPDLAGYADRRLDSLEPIDPLGPALAAPQAVWPAPGLGELPSDLDRAGRAGDGEPTAVEVGCERRRRGRIVHARQDQVPGRRHERGTDHATGARHGGQVRGCARETWVRDQRRADPEQQVVLGLALGKEAASSLEERPRRRVALHGDARARAHA
jgi:hypothetical protein